jgi:excisionase family DNA binding protein
MNVERLYLSPRETAAYLGMHVQTVYGWIASGEIMRSRLGRKVLIDLEHMYAKIKNQSAPAAADRIQRRAGPAEARVKSI